MGSTLVPMDILDQVARLMSALEAIDNEKRASLELGKAKLLRTAIGAYITYIQAHEWKSAREQLERIQVAIDKMLPQLPSSNSDTDR